MTASWPSVSQQQTGEGKSTFTGGIKIVPDVWPASHFHVTKIKNDTENVEPLTNKPKNTTHFYRYNFLGIISEEIQKTKVCIFTYEAGKKSRF